MIRIPQPRPRPRTVHKMTHEERDAIQRIIDLTETTQGIARAFEIEALLPTIKEILPRIEIEGMQDNLLYASLGYLFDKIIPQLEQPWFFAVVDGHEQYNEARWPHLHRTYCLRVPHWLVIKAMQRKGLDWMFRLGQDLGRDGKH